MQIIRRIVDLQGKLLKHEPLNVNVSSRDQAESYIHGHIAKTFAHHGYNPEYDYWWGRQENDTQISRFTIEA